MRDSACSSLLPKPSVTDREKESRRSIMKLTKRVRWQSGHQACSLQPAASVGLAVTLTLTHIRIHALCAVRYVPGQSESESESKTESDLSADYSKANRLTHPEHCAQQSAPCPTNYNIKHRMTLRLNAVRHRTYQPTSTTNSSSVCQLVQRVHNGVRHGHMYVSLSQLWKAQTVSSTKSPESRNPLLISVSV